MIRTGRNQQGPEYSQREAERSLFYEALGRPAISDGYDSGARPTPLDPILEQAADRQAEQTPESAISPGHIALMGDFE
jgi:hypothetical protein